MTVEEQNNSSCGQASQKDNKKMFFGILAGCLKNAVKRSFLSTILKKLKFNVKNTY